MTMLRSVGWIRFLKGLQALMVVFLILGAVTTFLALMSFDTVVGAYFFDGYAQQMDWTGGLWLSISTTGLTIVLGILSFVSSYVKKNPKAMQMGPMLEHVLVSVGPFAFWVSVVGALADVYLDMLSVDYFSYGTLITVSTLPETSFYAHWAARIIVASLSTVGEPLAMVLLGGFGLIIESVVRSPQPAKPATNHNIPREIRPQQTRSSTQRQSERYNVSDPEVNTPARSRPQPVAASQQRSVGIEPTYHPVAFESQAEAQKKLSENLPLFSEQEIMEAMNHEGRRYDA